MFHLRVKGRRKEDRVSLLLELGNNVMFSTDNFGLFLEGGNIQGPLNRVPELFNTVMSAKAFAVRETETVV